MKKSNLKLGLNKSTIAGLNGMSNVLGGIKNSARGTCVSCWQTCLNINTCGCMPTKPQTECICITNGATCHCFTEILC